MHHLSRTPVRGLLIVLVVLLASFSLSAQLPQAQRIDVVSFQQCANGAAPSTETGCVQWINGILNPNNSHYGEDQIVPQRAVFLVPAGGPATGRSLTFRFQSRKSGIHAYDSLGTWNYTQTSADRCQGLAAADCPSAGPTFLAIDDDPTPVNPASDGASNVTADHMLPAGAARQWVMYGGTLTGMSTYSHSNAASSTGDDDTTVTVYYSVPADAQGKVAADTKVMILYGGHTAVGLPVDPRGWGTALGSSSISGGPYHFRWIAADGTSVGNRDNQIQGSALTCTDPTPAITVDDSTCALSGGNVASTQLIANATYFWTVTNGSLDSGQGTNSITYTAGESGNVTIQVAVGVDGGCEGLAEEDVAIDPLTATEDLDPQEICEGDPEATFSVVATGSNLQFAWTFDGAPAGGNSSDLTIDTSALAPGTYDVSVEVTGDCGTSSESTTLTVNPDTVITDLSGDEEICEGEDATFTVTASNATGYVWYVDGVEQVGETGDSFTLVNPAPGTYTIKVVASGECDPDEATIDLTVNADALITDLSGDEEICEGEDAEFSVTATGATSYEWYVDNVKQSETGDSFTLVNPAPGSYTIKVVALGECDSDEATIELTVNADAVITDLDGPTSICEGDDATFTVTATGATSYEWYVDDVLQSESSDSFTLSNPSSGSYTIKVIALGECGPDEASIELSVDACDEFCSLTQGAYGNPNGSFWFNGVSYRRLPLIEALIGGTPIEIGDAAGSNFTIPLDGAQCVIDRLPAGGSASALPAGINGGVLSAPDCQTSPAIPTQKNKSEFNNVLLGQTITLALNLRLDPDLANFTLCSTIVTMGALPGPDGILGTEDDEPDVDGPNNILGDADDTITVVIPASVLAALGPGATVADLLDLANRGLAGLSTGGASLSDINAAVDAINRGFDECRFLVSCTSVTASLASRAASDSIVANFALCQRIAMFDEAELEAFAAPAQRRAGMSLEPAAVAEIDQRVLDALANFGLPRTVRGLVQLDRWASLDEMQVPVARAEIRSALAVIAPLVDMHGYVQRCAQ
jgi:hypothetical protein